MTDRQFVIEPLNGQSVNIRSGGQIVGRLTFVSSRVTGSTAGAAASLVTWAGNGQSAVAGATVTPPAVRVLDANGLPVAGSTVTWEGNTISGATQQGLTGTSDSNGVVTLGGWSVGTTAASTYTVFAYSGNLTNSPIRFSITPTAGSAFSVGVSAGDSQNSTPLSLLASRLTALVQDQYGNNVNGASVTWTSSAGDAAFGTAAGTTNSSGLVGTTYTTGQSASTDSVYAAISSATSARFGIGTYAAQPTTVQILSGDGQTALSGATLANVLVVSVEDGYGNPWGSGQTLQFVVVAGSGNVSNATLTPSNGTAAVTWKMGATAGINQLEVSLANISGSTVTFNASGTNPAADTIQIESGNNQTATVGAALSLPLAVATLGSGSSASGQVVTFSATSGSLSAAAVASSTSGIARTVWTMPQGAGTHTVTASAGTLTGSPLTFTATSTAGAATKLLLSTQPSSTVEPGVAWTQQPVVVSADQYGNLVSTNTRVGAVLTSGDGTLASGVSTFAVASGATATFSGLSYTYGSALDFQVAFRCNSLSTVTANGQTSQPPFANKLAFTVQPTSATTAGSLGNVTVDIQDALGARVTTATNAVTVALTTPGGATLSGTLTQNAASGQAVFAGLTVDTVGTYTLTATSAGLTGATSASFSITAVSGSNPNEPAGFTVINDTQFVGFAQYPGNPTTTVRVDGVARANNNGRGESVVDTVAPYAGQSVLRVTSPNGANQGNGYEWLKVKNASLQLLYQFASYSELYLHFGVRVDTGYRIPAGNGVQKLFHLCGTCNAVPSGAGGSLVVPSIIGTTDSTTATPRIQLRFQNLEAANPAGVSFNGCTGNGTSVAITRGAWADVEVYLKYNTGSNADGVAKLWVDGVLRDSATNLLFNDGATKRWTDPYLNPTYGGSGTINGDQYVYFSNWYMSGKA